MAAASAMLQTQDDLFGCGCQASGSFAGITTSNCPGRLQPECRWFALCRQVWYATTAALLPTFTLEGLVRRVNATSNSFSVFTKSVSTDGKTTTWKLETVTVDAKDRLDLPHQREHGHGSPSA